MARTIPSAGGGALDAYTAIRTKRDTREYLEKPIDADAKRRILQAGRMAGSSTNKQPYHFIVIESQDQRTAISACGNHMTHAEQSPLVVAIAMPDDHTLFDAGRAAQNMMVAAWEMGISSCPVVTHDTECSSLVLGVPQGMLVRYVVTFGYPPDPAKVGAGRARKPMDEILHTERW